MFSTKPIATYRIIINEELNLLRSIMVESGILDSLMIKEKKSLYLQNKGRICPSDCFDILVPIKAGVYDDFVTFSIDTLTDDFLHDNPIFENGIYYPKMDKQGNYYIDSGYGIKPELFKIYKSFISVYDNKTSPVIDCFLRLLEYGLYSSRVFLSEDALDMRYKKLMLLDPSNYLDLRIDETIQLIEKKYTLGNKSLFCFYMEPIFLVMNKIDTIDNLNLTSDNLIKLNIKNNELRIDILSSIKLHEIEEKHTKLIEHLKSNLVNGSVNLKENELMSYLCFNDKHYNDSGKTITQIEIDKNST